MRRALPVLAAAATLGGCGVWIDDASLPEVTPVDTTVSPQDSGGDTDSGPVGCARGDVEVYVGPPNGEVWIGQRIHLRFDAPIPPSDVQVSVVPRGGAFEAIEPPPFALQLAGDQVQIYEPPVEGWVPATTHDFVVTYGEGCSYSGTFRTGTLGAPTTWGTFGELRVLADLSQAVLLPLGLDLTLGDVSSQVIVDFNEDWSADEKPAGATVSGTMGDERISCGDSLYHQRTGTAPGHGSVRVPYRRVAAKVNGRSLPSVDGEVVVALSFDELAVPQMSLWLDVDVLGEPDVCQETACKACDTASETCALVMVESAPAERTDVDLPITVFNCFPSFGECPNYCPEGS